MNKGILINSSCDLCLPINEYPVVEREFATQKCAKHRQGRNLRPCKLTPDLLMANYTSTDHDFQ